MYMCMAVQVETSYFQGSRNKIYSKQDIDFDDQSLSQLAIKDLLLP